MSSVSYTFVHRAQPRNDRGLRKRSLLLIAIGGFLIVSSCLVLFTTFILIGTDSIVTEFTLRQVNPMPQVTVALVVCGHKLEQFLTLTKSLVIFSKNVQLRLIVFRDSRNVDVVLNETNRIQDLADKTNHSLEVILRDTWFPSENETGTDWRNWYHACASQRLFFPSLLRQEDSLLYLDLDTVVLSDLRDIWTEFTQMNEFQLAAMAAEHEVPGNGYYNTRAKHPYYGPRGLNSGVMLMRLDRMRQVMIEKAAMLIKKGFGKDLRWADQDIYNVFFHYYKEWLYLLPCNMNYRVQHCQADAFETTGLSVNCTVAEAEGIAILHGNRDAFTSVQFAASIYNAIKEYDLENSQPRMLLRKLKHDYLSIQTEGSPCSYMDVDKIFNKLEKYIQQNCN